MNTKTILKNYQKFNTFPFHIERFSPTEPIELHYHDCVELIFCTGGFGLNHVEDFCFEFGRDNIFVIAGRSTHSMSAFKNFEGFRILFDMSLFDTLDEKIKNTSGYTSLFLLSENGYINYVYRCCISMTEQYFDRLVHLMEDLLYEYENETILNEQYILSMFHTICILIIKCFESRQDIPMKILFQEAVAKLSEKLNDNIDIQEIAASFGISEQYLRRIFAEYGGISPMKLVTNMRLRRAKSLLACSDKPITEIAFSCGFYDNSHLVRVFKQYEGMTPKEYRKRTHH